MASLPPGQRHFFEKDNLAAVSTLGRDGGPRVTMVWVELDGDEIVLNSTESRNWPKNLKRDPRIAICVFDKQNVFDNVAVIGRVASISTEGGWEHIQKLARKYGLKEYQGARDRLIIRVTVEQSFLYRSRPGGPASTG